MAYRIVVGKDGKASLKRIMRRHYGAVTRPKLEPHRPELKLYLEAIWQDRKVRHPSHITVWNHSHGYAEDTLGLFHDKGRKDDGGAGKIRNRLRRLRPRGT